MEKYRLVLMSFILLCFIKCHSQNEEFTYPITKKQLSEKVYHGVKIVDEYVWLDQPNSNETKNWTAIQDSLSQTYIQDNKYYSLIKEKVESLTRFTGRTQLPVQRNGRYYYLTDNEKGQWNLYYKDKGSSPIVFGENIGVDARRIMFYEPSPNGKYIALGCMLQRGYVDWLLYDLEKQKLSEDTLKGAQFGKIAFAWQSEGKGFYFNTHSGTNDKGMRSGLEIQYYKIEGYNQQPKKVFKPNSDGSLIKIDVSSDGQYLVITEREGAAIQSKTFYGKLENEVPEIKPLIKNAENSFIFLGNRKDRFYFQTDWNASKGQIIEINLKKPSLNHWKTLITERKEAIMGYQSAGGTLLPVMSAGNFAVPYLKNLEQILKIYDSKGKHLRDIKLPSGGLYFNRNGWNAISASSESSEVLLKFIGITEPETVFSVNTATSEVTRFAKAKTQFNPENYTSEVVYCKSKDGTKVPITLTYKKGLVKDGNNYLMMQVYGAIAFTNYPYFQGDYITWLDMGGIHAVAHIRGGGALGSGWHQEGIKRKKQNGIDDYIASLEWVSKNKYTSPDKIIANGVSAGTIPVGGVLTQRPELIGGAVFHYGMLDMISYAEKYSKDQTHAYMIPELGNAKDKDDFKALQSYSPYQKLKSNSCYPPVLVLTSDMDAPMNTESYKFIAKLQNSNSSCSKPYLMQMAWGSVHSGFGSQNHSPSKTFADEISFLIKALNMDVSNWLEKKQ